MYRRFVASLFIVCLVCGVVGCAGKPASEPPKKDIIQLGVASGLAIDHIPTFVAKERGLFEKHGLDAKLAPPMATGIDQVAAIEAGQCSTAGIGIGPLISAVNKGIDLVIIAMQRAAAYELFVDDDQAVVARGDSGIRAGHPEDLRGKKIGCPVGTTAHQYILGVLHANKIPEAEVTIVNTKPEDLAAALQGGAVNAIACWEPWPSFALKNVSGSVLVVRDGGYVAPYSFQVAERSFVEKNPEAIRRFVTAYCEAQAWARNNPKEAAEIATRWIPGLDSEVAFEAMKALRRLQDPRISKITYDGLNDGQDFLKKMGKIDKTVDVNRIVEPRFVLEVMKQHPEFFQDLPPIPSEAQIAK